MNDKLNRAKEYANELDTVISFKKTILDTYLVLGIKDGKFKYCEFKDWQSKVQANS